MGRDHSQPSVSIIIPAYNQAHFLAEAIDSALAQTARDFEVIVVDDGSTDETAAIIQAYADQVSAIWQENQGLAGARNTGIRAARGHFVALLDSDDAWLPTYLENMLAVATKRPEAAVYYCGVSYMDTAGQETPQPGSNLVVPPGEMYQTLLRANFLVPSTILMRREAVSSVGLFDPAFRRLQDWELWLRMLRQGYTFAGLPDRLVRYRLHDSSLSTNPADGQQAAMALAVKHFGPDDGQPVGWTADKRRMFGGVYRYYALTTSLIRSADWQACAHYLGQAFLIDPTLTDDIPLFYELALSTQPLGKRGTAIQLDLEKNERRIAQLLAHVFRQNSPDRATLQRRAYGAAYYALGLVAYHMGVTAAARNYFWRAARHRLQLRFGVRCATGWLKTIAGRTALRRTLRPLVGWSEGA
jgi:glycosyltransferase involved in cell wall biosynthesis